jgi:hypothetical protein
MPFVNEQQIRDAYNVASAYLNDKYTDAYKYLYGAYPQPSPIPNVNAVVPHGTFHEAGTATALVPYQGFTPLPLTERIKYALYNAKDFAVNDPLTAAAAAGGLGLGAYGLYNLIAPSAIPKSKSTRKRIRSY